MSVIKIKNSNNEFESYPVLNTGISTELLDGKVDKVTGKGLSTNDFTDELKSKLEECYSKSLVDNLIAAINQFKYVIVTTLPAASADTMYKIYFVPSANSVSENVKDEYLTIETDGEYSWEKLGSTEIDLSGYATQNWVNELYTYSGEAGSFGPTNDVTGSNNATMNVPSITVDEKGRITAIENKVYTSKNTTYSAGTAALLTAGTNTTTRTWTAKMLHDAIWADHVVTTSSSSGGTLALDGSKAIHLVTLTGNVSALSLSTNPTSGFSTHIIFTATSLYTVAIAHDSTNRILPDAQNATLTVPANGYVEINFLNINNKIFVRGV